MSSHGCVGNETMTRSRQAGKGDRSVTESQTKHTNKAFDKPPIVLKPAVVDREMDRECASGVCGQVSNPGPPRVVVYGVDVLAGAIADRLAIPSISFRRILGVHLHVPFASSAALVDVQMLGSGPEPMATRPGQTVSITRVP